jgi:hypothetical protein
MPTIACLTNWLILANPLKILTLIVSSPGNVAYLYALCVSMAFFSGRITTDTSNALLLKNLQLFTNFREGDRNQFFRLRFVAKAAEYVSKDFQQSDESG